MGLLSNTSKWLWWMRGWLLDTLNYRIEKELRESVFQNPSYLSSRWNFLERQVLRWGVYHKSYVFGLCIAFILYFINGYLWLPKIINVVPQWKQPWGNIISWQGLVFGGQLTIIAIILPLAIAFIGQKIERNSASRALWQIYRSYSGLMFVGLSGLMLAVVIIGGQYFHPWLTPPLDILFSIGILLWFIFNLFLSAWFFIQTFQFMDNEFRGKLIIKYCINETILDEIRVRLAEVIPKNAVTYGLLKQKKNSKIEITTINFSENNDDQVSVDFPKDTYLKNISFRILSWVTWLGQHSDGSLCFPTAGKATGYKSWQLATTKGFSLTKWEKILIRRAYLFRTRPGSNSAKLNQVVNLLVGGIEDSIRDNNIRQFKIELREMGQWHSTIMDVSSFKNDQGNIDNWILLSDGSFFGNSILIELAKEYYEIAKLVIEQLPTNRNYFRKLCGLHLSIHRFHNDQLPKQVVCQLISNHYQIWIALIYWYNNLEETSSTSITEQHYNSAIRSYVGYWEYWLDYLPPTNKIEWDDVQNRIAPLMHHLLYTAKHIIMAIRHNNESSAGWAADMLLYWNEKLSNRITTQAISYFWHKELIHPTMLGEDISKSPWPHILNGQEFIQNDAVNYGLRNCWIDIRIITACYILGKHINSITGNQIVLIKALIAESRIKPTRDIDCPTFPVTTGIQILKIYISYQGYRRQGKTVYSNWLTEAVESFSEIDKEEMVSGRMYSGTWGENNMQNSFVSLAIGLSQNKWHIPEQFFDDLFLWRQDQRERFVRDLESWLNLPDEVFEKVVLINQNDCCELVDNFAKSVLELVKTITDLNDRVIVDAEQDPERLALYGKYASLTAFSANQDNLIFSLFQDVSYVDNLPEIKNQKISIANFSKSEIVKGVDVNRVVNEKESLADIMNMRVSKHLFRCLFSEKKYIEKEFRDTGRLLETAVNMAKKMTQKRKNPILFVGPADIEELLQKALWQKLESSEVLPFKVTRKDGYHSEYICHLDQIEVYHAPFSNLEFCTLTPKECFKSIQVQQFDDSRYVNAEFKEDHDDKRKGILELSYRVECAFSRDLTWKLQLKSIEVT